MCAPQVADEIEFTEEDIRINGLTLTVVGGASKGHFVILTSHEKGHQFKL